MTRKLNLFMGILLLLILTSACTRKETQIEEEAISITPTLQEPNLDNTDALELTQIEYIQNDFIVYFVNCATDKITEVADEDRIGLYQSVTDQSYGKDPGTEIIWGYQEKSYMKAEGDTSTPDKTAAKWVIREDTEINPKETGFYYDFSALRGIRSNLWLL
jgi:hypothetical protein